MSRLPHNIDTYRLRAKRCLPKAVFDFVEGGSEDEASVAGNREAFARLWLRPRVHQSTTPVDLSTTLCGQPLSMPVLLAPTGGIGLFNGAGDRAAAAAAASRGIIMAMSTAACYSIEEVASAADRKPWFQLYPFGDRDTYGSLLERAAAAGFPGLLVTVDMAATSRRERDIANAFAVPPRLTARNAFEAARHPRWTAEILRHRRVVVRGTSNTHGRPSLSGFISEARSEAVRFGGHLIRVTWDELAWIRAHWDGPMGIKGVLTADDARRAVDCGADLVVVSNHGGRQLDSAIPTLRALPEIVEAAAGNLDVVLDGGIRRGTDIIKALCLGARAVMIGRPFVYGLAVGGQAGVEHVLDALRHELATDLELLGQPVVRDLDESYLAPH